MSGLAGAWRSQGWQTIPLRSPIPVCASFESILGLPVVLLGFTPPDDNAHAPNESMSLPNHETGIRTVAAYWDELARLPR